MSNSEFPFPANPASAAFVLQTLIKTTHQVQREFERLLSTLGLPSYLTGSRLRVLLDVSQYGSIRMSDLAKNLGVEARVVTQYVDTLEGQNLLVRTADPTDRRATLVKLTDEAFPIIEKARIIMEQAAEKIFEGISIDSRKELIQQLTMLTHGR
ncbi:MarR family winged helix-turn-helix transcriptional regulator [Paenibacillus sp. PL91]|uniref:MarR family winged helix-turn-helix transcriptional regulator n=1 Tax=Paenibacillus sp. PL91 TaxID=2729538 RepID=UPI00145CB2D1|nr:MarR family transcriptional regulator [Paenibacillus sp. PL91]MBC9204766.1 MarR family transcriptional regulator [Paenibacillus sp. PL91]